MRGHLSTLTVVALLAAACSSSEPLDGEGKWATGKLTADAPLWDDPQNTPHPVFNWPTLSSPPMGGELPKYWKPIPARELPKPITGLMHVAQAERIPSSGGMALFGSLAVLPGLGNESSVVDLRDPAAPRRLSRFNLTGEKSAGEEEPDHGLLDDFLGVGSHRGAAMIAYPSGRLVAVFATNTVIDVWDLTDPVRPRPLTPLRTARSHKVGVVPGTPIVYNAASQGGSNLPQGSGFTEIFDLTDPEHPIHVQNFPNGYSCHHVFFWNNPAQNKYRAICAGVEYTQLWDTLDPRNPRVIVSLPVHHGIPGTPSAAVAPVTFSHSAGLNRDGTVLYVGDENGGGGLPPGCVASAATPAGDPSTPVGALWFYDVSIETAPVLRGWYSALNDPRVKSPLRSCTAHHGRLVPDPDGRDLLAMSFYGDGVILLDFSNPLLPHAIAQFAENSNTWETWYHNGYLVTGDLARGMDVLTFQ
jgi:hypothetical protein